MLTNTSYAVLSCLALSLLGCATEPDAATTAPAGKADDAAVAREASAEHGDAGTAYIDDVAEACGQSKTPGIFASFFACAAGQDASFHARLMDGTPYEMLGATQRHLIAEYVRLALDYSPSAYTISPGIKHMLLNAIELADQELLRSLSDTVFVTFTQRLPRVEYDLFYAYDLDDVIQRMIERADAQTLRYFGINHYRKWNSHFYTAMFAKAFRIDDRADRTERLAHDLKTYRDQVRVMGSMVIVIRETMCFENKFSLDMWKDLYNTDTVFDETPLPPLTYTCNPR